MKRYRDRAQAADELLAALHALAGVPGLVVLAIPRGGVPIASDIAHALGAPLDVVVVRKVWVPDQPDLSLGAVASGGVRLLDPAVAGQIRPDLLEAMVRHEEDEVHRREGALRGHRRPHPDLRDKLILLVDDGLATGFTMHAAVRAVRAGRPRAIVVATPVSSESAAETIRAEVDELICPCPVPSAVCLPDFYEEFEPVADAEVRGLLEHGWKERAEQGLSP